MADNIMGGYNSSDITANIEVNLNNIDRSTQDAATLAAQLQDWGSSIEAANKQLQDYNTSQEDLLQTSEKLADVSERIVDAARQLKEISASSNVNFRDLAQNAREIQNALSGLGGGVAGPYVPGVSSTTPASLSGDLMSGGGMPGAPDYMPDDYGADSSSVFPDLIAASAASTKGYTGKRRATAAASTDPAEAAGPSYGDRMVKKMLGINYWMPGGKLAALGRYIDKFSEGKVSARLSSMVTKHPGIFGSEGVAATAEKIDEGLYRNMMAKASFADAHGIGLGPAEARAMAAADGAAPELIDAVAAAEAAAVVPGVAGVAAGGGLIGSLASAAVPLAGIAAAGYIGMKAYNAYATYQQQGQLLGSLTGENNAGKMVGMEANDFVRTLFNPRLSYGTAKEIQMTGLAAGFQGDVNGVFNGGTGANAGLLGQYTGFASSSYQKYGMSPQDSMQMFNSAIIDAGGTVQQLTGALENLAQVSATTNTSFKQLQANFTNQASLLGGLGMQGGTALYAAESLSLANSGNSAADVYLQKQNIGGTGGLLQNTSGIALTAAAAGMSFTQAFGQMGTSKGAASLLSGTNSAILAILKNSLGLYPGMPNLELAISNNLYQAYVILSKLLPEGPDGKGAQWTPQAAHDWLKKELSGAGGGESVAAGSASDLTGLVNTLTGGKTGTAGVNNAINTIAGALGGTTGLTLGHTGSEIEIDGKWQALNTISNMDPKQQQQVLTDLLQGKDKVRDYTLGLGSTSSSGKAQTLADLMNNSTLQGINNGSITQSQMQVELGPKAAALFELINNPQKLTNQQLKYLSSMGLNVNTHQTTGYSP